MNEPEKFFYSNSLQLSSSAFDFSLKFLRHGINSNSLDASNLSLQQGTQETLDKLTVCISPALAKIMLLTLHNSIITHEKQLGKINIPEPYATEFKSVFGDN